LTSGIPVPWECCSGNVDKEMGMEEFDYFMVRVRRTVPEEMTGTLSGVAERLGTGEKWNFGSGEELLHVVSGAPRRIKNMQSPDTAGKPTVS
jgi:hypothetical protein